MGRTILVTAGTGKIGSELVRLLTLDPEQPTIRVATRDPASRSARALTRLGPGVVPVALDVGDPASVRAAADGVDGVMMIVPFTPDMTAWHEQLLGGVASVGAPLVVKVSVTGARLPDGEPRAIPERHGVGERVLRESGLPNVSIRPTIFAQHFTMNPVLYVLGADRFFLPTGDTAIAFLDCRDIAAFGAAILLAPDAVRAPLLGNAYELTGAGAVSGADIAAILSDVAGRPVTHVDGREPYAARAAELGVGAGPVGIYAEAADGWFSAVAHDPFTAVVGRSPRSFAHFAMDHAALFAPR